jgi:hypothetical protein
MDEAPSRREIMKLVCYDLASLNQWCDRRTPSRLGIKGQGFGSSPQATPLAITLLGKRGEKNENE